MTCPPFNAILEGEQPEHVATCKRCQDVALAIRKVREAPRCEREFRRNVMSRLHRQRRPWRLAAFTLAAAALIVFVLQPDSTFLPRGANRDIGVEIEAQGRGYVVRVKNATDRDVFIGAYLQDAEGERHWLAPHWPVGSEPPSLVRIKAHTKTTLLDTGVIPDAPAKGHGELVGFATDAEARVEALITPIYEQRISIEVP